MATLQRPKPKTRATDDAPSPSPLQQINEDATHNRSNDEQATATNLTNGNTNELEQLMLEPVSYDQLCTTPTTIATKQQNERLSTELVHSLQSVKQVCLVALDSLLRQMVNAIPSTKPERRLSDSSLHEKTGLSLLGSIVQSTNRLSSSPSQQDQQRAMKRSDSSPAVTTLSIVQQVLTSHQPWILDSSTDYHMCCSLAALLHNVYRILELGQRSSDDGDDDENDDNDDDYCTSPLSPTASIYTQLRESMTTFQKDKATAATADKTSMREMSLLWDEVDQLMNSITCLAQDRPDAPPAYHDSVEPPSLPSPSLPLHSCEKSLPSPPGYAIPNEKAQHDLDQLLSAIDQLSSVSPRLNNQRADLTERQAKELAAATVGRTVERLSRGRLETQQAKLPLTKVETLQGLMTQIQRSSLRSLDNQRACMNTRLKKKMNVAAMNELLDRNDRGRLTSQDWATPEQRMIDDMTNMTDMLTKVMNRPKYNQQRYSLSSTKEREFFFIQVLHKVDRMEDRRMTNQDAEWTRRAQPKQHAAAEMEDELGSLFDNIHRSKSQLDNQRASFSTTPSSTSPPLILSTVSS